MYIVLPPPRPQHLLYPWTVFVTLFPTTVEENSKFAIKVYKLLCTCGFPTTLIFSTVLVADLCVYINRSMVSVVASHLSSCVNIEATLRASLSGTFLQEECRKPVLGVCREVGLGCHSLSHSSPVPDKPCMVSVDVKLQWKKERWWSGTCFRVGESLERASQLGYPRPR